ncbi:MAG: hypothetical protein NC299_07180 [Lachnospiraceae bacterium]|nr:hypothetical protein [Ruminococcus sp.]MCM1275137.1 hypothetical protein [Lachnospiraceae bacterium]
MKRFDIRRALAYLIPTAVFSAMLVWFIIAVGNADSSAGERELAAVKSTIENGVTMCYAIEGAYPESVEYLAENYGLIYDGDKYIVYYDRFADNVRPTVSVLERKTAQ